MTNKLLINTSILVLCLYCGNIPAQAASDLITEAKHANCLKARQQLTQLQLRNRVKMIGSDGQATMLSEQQKIAEIAKTREAIKTYCAEPMYYVFPANNSY